MSLIEFNINKSDSGSLIAINEKLDIPFNIKRVYYIFDVDTESRRGFHAHKKLKQVIIALGGSCKVMLDNGYTKEEYLLNNPQKGLLIEKTMWREMYDFSKNCVLLVLVNELYDEADYIRDYEQFKSFLGI